MATVQVPHDGPARVSDVQERLGQARRHHIAQTAVLNDGDAGDRTGKLLLRDRDQHLQNRQQGLVASGHLEDAPTLVFQLLGPALETG